MRKELKPELLIAALIGLMIAAALSLFPGCASMDRSPASPAYPLTQPIDPVTEEVLNVQQ